MKIAKLKIENSNVGFTRQNLPKQISGGFILILAVIVASILLSIGVGIADFALKELQLSTAGRESLYAYYSADSGIECDYFWDNVREDQTVQSAFNPDSLKSISCAGTEGIPANLGSGVREFVFYLKPEQTNCDKLSVTKEYNSSRHATTTTTRSWGFNTSCDALNPRKIDRGIFVRY